ncbi:phage regulatory CII family protein [Marinomonas fungiae]|uniref:phage regulatory CII family protein n=1 Tax=Marinomonas fungiae TaxID=1137284 RepID=UPI003A8FF51A
MDQLDQATHDIVHKSELTAKQIADRLGMSHQTLINKANPNSEFHKLTVREAYSIQLLTGNHSLAVAMKTMLDVYVCEDKPASIIECALNATKENGDVVAAVQAALADGHLTEREKSELLREISEAIASLETLRGSVLAAAPVLYITRNKG